LNKSDSFITAENKPKNTNLMSKQAHL